MTDSWRRDAGNPVTRWVLLTGHRLGVAGTLSVLFATLAALLIGLDLVHVGPGSNLPSVLSSGLLSGLLTLLTVALSVNQLILSRVFGSAGNLSDQLEGTLDYRRTVEVVAEVATSPTEPTAFLGFLADTLERRIEDFRRVTDGAAIAVDADDDFGVYAATMLDYADYLSTADDLDDPTKALLITLGTDYSDHLETTRKLRNRYSGRLSDESASALDDVLVLLTAVATMRQFFKTLVLQQETATLSRRLIYTSVPAILVTYFLPLIYTVPTDMPTAIDPTYVPLVVTVATGVVLSPLAVLVASLLRVATVSLYTVSIGPFIPPEETFDND